MFIAGRKIVMSDVLGLVVLTLLAGWTVAEDWTVCPPVCKCKWVSGKKTADCIRAELYSIPQSFSSEIQSLDLSENQLERLPSEAFKSVGLVNLHKIYLRDCKIKELNRDAFKDLGILVEVDLSENMIHVLHPGTFRDNIRLRILIFSRNLIRKIESNLFNNLFYLQTIEMSSCLLTEIDDRAFLNVTNLLHLKLNGNKLSHIKLSLLKDLMKIRSLVLHDNPWKCDCHMRDLRNFVVHTNLYSSPTACFYPETLHGKQWNNVKAEEFACKPQITWPGSSMSVAADSRDVSLGCKVTGDPLPQVHWFHNSINISDNAKVKYNTYKYSVKTEMLSGREKQEMWVNLTITQVSLQDKGVFRCIARNPGGRDEKNITLLIDTDADGFIPLGKTNDSWPLIIGLVTGLVALFIIAAIFCCWFSCRHKQCQSKKSSANSLPSNGDLLHHITNSNKQEKCLLTVNPVQKPPRRYEAQIVSNNDSVEVSELNRKLLDENTLLGKASPGEEEDYLEEDKAAQPPDLLAFPSRSENISPASSSTSNGFETLSLYPTLQQSFLKPTLHFGTLPYSRSHSPFSPSAPLVLPRQGYVTIPRRPRVPSWSSAPTPSLLDDPLSPIKAEPVYDNLGPRTTADGSSVLSLNKSFPDNPRSRNASNASNYFYSDGNKRPCPSPISPERENKKDVTLERACPGDGPTRSKVAPKPPPKPAKDGPLFEDEGEDGTEV